MIDGRYKTKNNFVHWGFFDTLFSTQRPYDEWKIDYYAALDTYLPFRVDITNTLMNASDIFTQHECVPQFGWRNFIDGGRFLIAFEDQSDAVLVRLLISPGKR
jgi:hypothetical protein